MQIVSRCHASRARRCEPTPEVDHRLAAEVDADCGAARTVERGERVAHRLEARRSGSARLAHVDIAMAAGMLAARAGCAADEARVMRPIVVLGGYGRLGRACVLGARSADERAASHRRPQRAARRVARALARRARDALLRRRRRSARAGPHARGRGGGGGLHRRRVARRAAERARAARAVRRRLAAAARRAQPAPRRRARLARASSGRAACGRGARHSGNPRRVAGAPAAGDRPAADRVDGLGRRDRARATRAGRARGWPERWHFADPIGPRAVVRASSADLDGFAESHCVAELEYLEPPTRGLARTVSRLVARSAGAGFAVAARATPRGDGPAVELEVSAPDAISAAAALVGALCAGILERAFPPVSRTCARRSHRRWRWRRSRSAARGSGSAASPAEPAGSSRAAGASRAVRMRRDSNARDMLPSL